MKVQSFYTATTRYYHENQEQTISRLFLDEDEKKNQKPRFEIRTEGGYIRKYIVKANGDKILVMETKQTEAQKRMQTNETGNVIDMAHDLLMKQLQLTSDSKKPLTVQERKKGMAAYQTGI